MKTKLLNKVLADLKTDTGDFKPVNYNKNIIPDLIAKSEDCGMVENLYCCYGLETCCWQEVIEDGIWNYDHEKVKNYIIREIKDARKYLYNGRKYGKPRFYIAENSKYYNVFIFLRDTDFQVDYHIWFKKKEVK